MEKTKNSRQSNIELLRILAAMGVIVLHYNNETIGAAFSVARSVPQNYFLLMFLQAVFVSAVNLFIVISGFFLIQTEKRDLRKPLQLVVLVVIYGAVRYLFYLAIGREEFSFSGLIGRMIPNNYFVLLYTVLYLLSPYVNRLIFGLSREEFRKLVAVLFVVFSVYPFLADTFGVVTGREWDGLSPISASGSLDGYTIVNFGMMYVLGAYEYKIGFGRQSMKKLLLLELGLVSGILALSYWSEKIAWEYCSPLVVLSAVTQLRIFRRIEIGNIKWINLLSKSIFSCYLLHTMFLPMLNISAVADKNVGLLLLHVIGSAAGIFLICWCIHLVIARITDSIIRKLPEQYFTFKIG